MTPAMQSELQHALDEVGPGQALVTASSTFQLSPNCIVDHDSLAAWSECGQCKIMHEPRLITGEGPKGRLDGPGRGKVNVDRLWFYVGYLRPKSLDSTNG